MLHQSTSRDGGVGDDGVLERRGSVPQSCVGLTEHAMGRFSEGAAVQYQSTTFGGWVPAVVRGFDTHTSTYILDVQPVAIPSKVRAAPPASGATAGASGKDTVSIASSP